MIYLKVLIISSDINQTQEIICTGLVDEIEIIYQIIKIFLKVDFKRKNFLCAQILMK